MQHFRRHPDGIMRTRGTTRRAQRNVAAAVLAAIAAASIASAVLAVPASSDGGKQPAGAPHAAVRAAIAGPRSSTSRPPVAEAAPVPDGLHRFVGVAATPIAAAPGGPAFATLYLSAPLTIVGAGRDAAHAVTRLWTHGTPTALGLLYAAPNGVEVGQFLAGSPAHVIPRSAVDGWTAVDIDGFVAVAAVVDALDRAWQEAEVTYHLECAECHRLHTPDEYSSMQWGMIVPRMARFAKLVPDDATLILKWLQTASSTSESRR